MEGLGNLTQWKGSLDPGRKQSLQPRQNETESSAHRLVHDGEKAPGLRDQVPCSLFCTLQTFVTPHALGQAFPRWDTALSPAFGIQIVTSSVKPSVTGQRAFRALCIASRLSYRSCTLHCSPPSLPCPRGGDIMSLRAPAPSPSGAWLPVTQ